LLDHALTCRVSPSLACAARGTLHLLSSRRRRGTAVARRRACVRHTRPGGGRRPCLHHAASALAFQAELGRGVLSRVSGVFLRSPQSRAGWRLPQGSVEALASVFSFFDFFTAALTRFWLWSPSRGRRNLPASRLFHPRPSSRSKDTWMAKCTQALPSRHTALCPKSPPLCFLLRLASMPAQS